MIMNARLKLFFLANLSRQKIGSDRGFALPIALMVGMVILVVGATMIIRAQSDQSKIIAQTTSNKAMAIAEAGATRYIDFLNNNRGLIPYSACMTQDATTGVCSDTSSVKSWYGAGLTTTGSSTSIPNIKPSPSTASPSPSPSASPSCSTSGSSASLPSNYQSPSTSSSTIATWANSTDSGISSGWRNVDLNDGSKGQYRLVSYRTYKDASASSAMSPDTDAPTTVASARLIVEGRVNQNGTGASATDGSNGGKARVEITIPVTATTSNGASPSTTTGFPGIWSEDFMASSMNARSDIWKSPACSSSNTVVSGSVTPPNSVLDPLPNVSNGLPVLATSGTNIYTTTGTTTGTITAVNQDFPALPNNTPPTTNTNSCGSWSTRYPRTGDVASDGTVYSGAANDAKTYIYNCGTGDKGGSGSNVTLGRTGLETLVFYIDGKLDYSSDGSLIPYDGGANGVTRTIFYVSDGIHLNGGGSFGNKKDPSALQFYDYNTGSSTSGWRNIASSNYQHYSELNAAGNFYGFLFGPNDNLVTSTSSAQHSGAIWVKSLEVQGSGTIWQGIFNTSRLMITMPSSSSYTNYNLDGSPTAWKRVQAN